MNFKICINISRQILNLVDSDGAVQAQFAVSTALNGAGQKSGSEKTPLGKFIIRAKIGAGLPSGSVLVGRRPTGELYSERLQRNYPERDWILTRILWLSGTEPGFNRMGAVDTMRRYIYIHGTPDSEPMGIPKSHGCIRMRNQDIIQLFELVPAYTPVVIES